ncbi:hypothetical protein TRFO_27540 [Tritrichomonas foetus]|uniref:Uncharacterized protein n=1 Tax=Tritrichomonas foetus TaxID=1144522 RepID=A0A1J4K0U1_9EUKA|nr:hypothetical protein TRFO_27540 [Tritrichomonas foetus]|eukprot:OHT04867.1 hypothetical protein TRFO_27540 [Tritrichomonas foetus]
MNVNLLKDAVEKLEVRKKQAQAELDILLSGDELYKSKEIEADVINLYEEYQRLSTEIVKSNDYMNVVLKDIECATNIIKDSKMEEKETIKINKEVEELRLQINQQKINKQKLSDESSSLKKESIITEIENLESTLNAEKVSAIKSEEIEKQSSIDLNDTITFAVLRLQETMKEINKEKNSQK